MSWKELLFDLVTLWVTVDPVGTVPLYLSVTKDMSSVERKRAAVRATIIAFFLLAGFLYLGQYLLEAMRIELLSFHPNPYEVNEVDVFWRQPSCGDE